VATCRPHTQSKVAEPLPSWIKLFRQMRPKHTTRIDINAGKDRVAAVY
jgi:hypothetical protein